jgi:hypothetical protein
MQAGTSTEYPALSSASFHVWPLLSGTFFLGSLLVSDCHRAFAVLDLQEVIGVINPKTVSVLS